MSKTEPTTMKNLPLASIIVNAGIQTRIALDEDTVEAYAEDLKALPPVTVFQDPDSPKVRHLADGFHRYEAHLQQGAVRIKSNVMPGTAADALDFACGSNATHGLRRTIADKRNAAGLALAAHDDWSDRKLAKLCNVSNHFVARIRAERLDHGQGDGNPRRAAVKRVADAPAPSGDISTVTSKLPTQHDMGGNVPTQDAATGKPETAANIFPKADLALGAVQRRLDELGDLLGKELHYKFCMDQVKAAITGLQRWQTAQQMEAVETEVAPVKKKRAPKKKAEKKDGAN